MLVKNVCRKCGISSPTYYLWRSKYGGMEASELKLRTEIESEIAKLKRMYADLALENVAIREFIKKRAVALEEKRARV